MQKKKNKYDHHSDDISLLFEELYKTYYKRTFFFVRQYLLDDEEAKEIAQETFITLWDKRLTLNYELNIQSYIFTIAKNKCLNVLRKKINQRKYADKLSLQEAIVNRDALLDDSFDFLVSKELSVLIDKVIGQLPSKSAKIFKMSRDEDMTYDEIAQELGLSKKSVEYHISRVLSNFRISLKDYIAFIFFFLGLSLFLVY